MNNLDKTSIDALIFDMDGTLWDAVDSYCEVWNACFRKFGVERTVMRDELLKCMGLPLDVIYKNITGDNPQIAPTDYLPELEKLEMEMMPHLGGRPYPMMKEGMAKLSEHYRIFLLSNCGVRGLEDMMDFTGIRPYVTEAVSFGATQREKSENMLWLKKKYELSNPIYIGDTEGDCRQTRMAGMPFAFAAYGFGTCENPDWSFNSFEELTDYFIKAKAE